jgi:hypothetical protein
MARHEQTSVITLVAISGVKLDRNISRANRLVGFCRCFHGGFPTACMWRKFIVFLQIDFWVNGGFFKTTISIRIADKAFSTAEFNLYRCRLINLRQ